MYKKHVWTSVLVIHLHCNDLTLFGKFKSSIDNTEAGGTEKGCPFVGLSRWNRLRKKCTGKKRSSLFVNDNVGYVHENVSQSSILSPRLAGLERDETEQLI